VEERAGQGVRRQAGGREAGSGRPSAGSAMEEETRGRRWTEGEWIRRVEEKKRKEKEKEMERRKKEKKKD